MTVKYEVRYNGFCHYINVDEPEECPICKHSLKPTILDKNYVIQKLEETDFYSGTYKLVESNFEKYIYQSGLDEDVLKSICTEDKVKNDINLMLSNIYDGTNKTIDTTEISTNLNANIDKLEIKTKQNEKAINEFVTHICNEYTDTLVHSKYENQINNVYKKAINNLNKVYNAILIVTVVDLILILIINNKKVSKNLQDFGIAMMATSIFGIAGCQIVQAKVNIQGIKIFNDVFSNSLVTIVQDVFNKFTSLPVGMLVIAIVVVGIYVAIVVSKKTKENIETGREM